MGANGRRYFEAHYAWDVVERKYLELIARLQSENARGRQARLAGAALQA